jgi:hypothetical protein
MADEYPQNKPPLKVLAMGHEGHCTATLDARGTAS